MFRVVLVRLGLQQTFLKLSVMGSQGSESSRGDTSSSRRILKMHTIPTETPERKTRRSETQQSFETDDEFQFRRHSAKKSQFGDRLQEFQNVRDARRVENFNSSFQAGAGSQLQSQPPSREKGMGGEPMSQEQQFPLPSQLPPQGQMFPYPAQSQLQSPHRMIPMPMVYYYPAAAQQQQQQQQQQQRQQYAISPQELGINFQAMNQFMDSQYHEQQPQHYYPSLMPAPSFYPPQSAEEKLPNSVYQNRPSLPPEDARAKRKSFILQRGRRLSLLNQENQLNDIISPHKDVHESEFYRYMNNSFAQDLKMKQLMNWCLIRTLRKTELKNAQLENKSESKKIALTILKDFVRDIRKGNHDIDWESEGPEQEPDTERVLEDEAEISNLFKDDNNVVVSPDFNSSPTKKRTEVELDTDEEVKTKPKTKGKGEVSVKFARIPNEKNIQNKESVKILEKKIQTIQEEVEQWSRDLSKVKLPHYKLPEPQTAVVKLPDNLQLTATSKEAVHLDFQKRIDGLQETTRLLSATSKLLEQTASMKLKKLNNCMVSKTSTDKTSTKTLLRGLSRSLLQ